VQNKQELEREKKKEQIDWTESEKAKS
jgi:hypothetical protein